MTNNLLYFQGILFLCITYLPLDNSLELALAWYYNLCLYYTKTFTGASHILNAKYAYARLMVNGTEILHAVAEAGGDFQEDQGANTAVVQCNKGDEVWVTGKGELPGESNTRTSSFSGFLLHQTTD